MIEKQREKLNNLPESSLPEQSGAQARQPVVVVLGHVDHGKSSLLEAIKDFKITAKESGGITQHIGAYEVEQKDKKITFIDTPGHEAFSAMRSRGAKVADIAILVIAADEGIKPQTKEAILHIKKAEIPLIVALNKIDKQEANPAKVKKELSGIGILVESLGGKVPSVEVSAKSGKGIEELLELILLLAEMEELKADIAKPAEGIVIESYLDALRGPTATLILQQGILKKGDISAAPSAMAKIKNIENFQGKTLEQALPGMPAIILGFDEVPAVGEKVRVFNTIEEAEKIKKTSLKTLPEVIQVNSDQRVLNIILKTDVFGSLEAIEEILRELPQEKVVLRILKGEVGQVQESDVKLAIGAKAKILAFRVKTNPIAQQLAAREKISIINFEIIYELVQATRQLLEKMVKSEEVRVELGKVKILAVFLREKNKRIVGGKVIEGKIARKANFEVWRGEEMAGQGNVAGLQRDKKEIEEVGKGAEFGMRYEGGAEIEQGDILQVWVKEKNKEGI